MARFRGRLCFVLQQALSFHTHHHLFRQGVALAGIRQSRSLGTVCVDTHCTEGVTGSKGREGANGVGGGIGVGGGNGDGTGVGGGDGDVKDDGVGDAAGTGTRVEAIERT